MLLIFFSHFTTKLQNSIMKIIYLILKIHILGIKYIQSLII